MITAGIWSVGTYLPPIIRKNDYWPEEIVAGWRARQQRNLTRSAGDDDGALDPGAMTIIKHMMRFKADPFEGVEERRIMPDELSTFNECFIVGSAAEVTPVAEIGPYSFKPGNISRTMMDSYTNAIRA